MPSRGARASCGRAVHGKPLHAGGGIGSCFACGRVGGRDGIAGGWKHVGNGPYWAELGAWAEQVGDGWVFERDLAAEPFEYGECICTRPGCAANLYQKYKLRCLKDEQGSLDRMATGQHSPMGRFPSTSAQVRGLLSYINLEGRVLDSCGATGDAVARVMTAHGLRVSTNDLNPSFKSDFHMDAASEGFGDAFTEESVRPDWIVTSPPYKNVLGFLKQAFRVARLGVAFKLRLSFLEPTKTRGTWLNENPPHALVVLPRATYRGRECSATEAWFVWHCGPGGGLPRVQAIFVSL